MKNLIIIPLSLLLMSAGFNPLSNIHETDPGKLFRSAQLSAEDLKELIVEKNIKTVINLRGANDKVWYKEELQTTKDLNVVQYDIGMGAKRLPHKADLKKLLIALQDAPRPILIHCQGGADRTGEAVAIYQMIYMEKPKEVAVKQLAMRYFHIERKAPAKKYFINEVWKGADWAMNSYDPCVENYQFYDHATYCNDKSSKVIIPSDE